MTVEIIDKQKAVTVDRSSVRRVVRRILEDHSLGDSDATIVFARDDFVRELNLTYREIDRPTDVLAFAMRDAAGVEPDPLDMETVLGDVIISVDRASVQARRFRRTVDHEILKLVAHGVLHLLGYEHGNQGARKRMRRLENRYAREELGGAASGRQARRTRK